jgi:hypothetical protein
MTDAHTMSHLGTQFAITLRNRNPSVHLQDIIAAFLDGFQQGLDNIERFARKRPRNQRKGTA